MKMSEDERDRIGCLAWRVRDRNKWEENKEQKQEIKELVAVVRVLVALNEADEVTIVGLREQLMGNEDER